MLVKFVPASNEGTFGEGFTDLDRNSSLLTLEQTHVNNDKSDFPTRRLVGARVARQYLEGNR